LEYPLGIEKFDWKNITEDFGKMQRISGIGAFSAIVVAAYLILTTPLASEQTFNLILTLITATIFVVIFYSFPKFYLNKNLLVLPDIVFIVTIAIGMLNFGDQGDIFIVFLILMITLNSFMYPLEVYLISLCGSVLAVFAVHLTTMGSGLAVLGHRTFLVQAFGILSVGTIMRIFATETISLKKREENLRAKTEDLVAQKKELFLLIDSIHDGIIATDAECKITLINKTALKILGMIGSTKMLLGKDANQILTTIGNDGKFSVLKEAMDKEEPVIRDDLRLVREDKTLKLHTNTTPILNNGQIKGAIVLFRDVTATKKLEEQRAEFNAIASHELRTPLTIIEGYLYYLLTESDLKYDKKTKEFIRKSHEASSQLLHLTNDILTVIKADENELKVNIEDTDIKKLVKTIVDGFKPKAAEAKIKLVFETTGSIPKVETDQSKIKEVITNLIENAIKFTEKGSVNVRLSYPKQGQIMLEVIDTGIGISTENQKMIFHKFYRSEDWQTRKRGGTGLGLYISKTFIERLGGRIAVKSDKGKGSNFYFKLPTKPTGKLISKAELNQFIKSKM
jgi:PAS domain S-box-containing protein